MADQTKIGTDWSDEELDSIVEDYFDMLAAEHAGRHYVKAAHSAALMARIGRTHRSVEFKHMNISAVLEALGMPRIAGYKPKENYQRSIFPAIERYLVRHPGSISPKSLAERGLQEAASLFVEAPPHLRQDAKPWPPELARLVRKFDPSERDFRNRELGKAGEALIVEHERAHLVGVERPDLARKVRWVSQEDGDGAGYDILSFDYQGKERLIEVKTTLGGQRTPFYVTRNELALSEERKDAFKLLRLYDFARMPRAFELEPPLEALVKLSALTYEASFN